MIPHCAQCASNAHPHVPIGEHIADNGEGMSGVSACHDPLGEALAGINERLAVVAVAAHIMERRAPRDCYARSSARETQALALEMCEALHRAHAGEPIELAPRIVDATPDTAPAPSSTPTRRTPRARRQTGKGGAQ